MEEGAYQRGLLNGYGRIIYSTEGDDQVKYYQGMFEGNFKSGEGMQVYNDGRVEEGIFEKDELKEAKKWLDLIIDLN